MYTLLLGSNIGERQRYIQFSRELLEKRAGKIVAASSVHETEAWGKEDQNDFLNQVIVIESELVPTEFMELIAEIENGLGRERQEKWGPRTIDIDILFTNKDVMESEALTIPHPQMHLRPFTLHLLEETHPDWVHPVLNLSVQEMLADLGETANS